MNSTTYHYRGSCPMGSNRRMTVSASKWITLLSLLVLCPLQAGTVPAKLTNEDIVRMTASDVPESEILRVIRETKQVEFDLEGDVVTEMRLVGVSDAVIKAMEDRVRKTSPPPQTAEPDEVEGAIEIEFRQEETPETKKKPGLPLERGSFFVICLDPTHVPDHWTTKTPLAQKFPRHHLVWFNEPPLLAADTDKGKRDKLVPLPASARVMLPVEAHPIQAGIAVWAA